MDELIKLLNEYMGKDGSKFVYDWTIHDGILYAKANVPFSLSSLSTLETNAVLISKEFGFIQWLIQNDKIDGDKVDKVYYKKTYCGTDGKYISYAEFLDCENLLMLLAISDNPISDLISYLK